MNRIGIIGAMDEEVDILVDLMDIKETIEKASLKFYKGTLEGKDIVLVRCGIGKVNSALCAQILISEFDVDAIVNTGVAGALHSELDVLDMVISTDAIQYDVDTTAFGDPKGTHKGKMLLKKEDTAWWCPPPAAKSQSKIIFSYSPSKPSPFRTAARGPSNAANRK